MRGIFVIPEDILSRLRLEPGRTRERVLQLADTFETNWPKLQELWHRDRRLAYNLWRRRDDGVSIDYGREVSQGRVVYTVLAVHYLTTRSLWAKEESRAT